MSLFLVLAVGSLLAFLRIGPCPNREGRGYVDWGVDLAWQKEHPRDARRASGRVNLLMTDCCRCGGGGRSSVLSRWLWGRPEPLPLPLLPPLDPPRDLDPSKPIQR